jgi:predicted RNA binding protein YcfA (HicA-like mRNA interferase family)
MTRLPSLRPRPVIRALERAGFEVVRIRGSHYQLVNPTNGRRATVPHHNRDLSKGTMASIVNQSGLTVEEFLKLI